MKTRVSIAIPHHQTGKTAFFLSRLLDSVHQQSYKDYEIILTAEGEFARNHNAAIQKSKSPIVKLMQMDDYFAHPQALQRIVDAFDSNQGEEWFISPTLHTDGSRHSPQWTNDIYTGNNRLGSVSSIAFRKRSQLLFEEPLTWVVDCDWYYRMYLKYGEPKIIEDYGVIVDTRTDRLSHTIPDKVKIDEVNYLIKKYGK